jgi:hypothetical protein
MKWSFNFKLLIGLVAILLLGFVMPSCKSKKKCPDFTQVGGKIKKDRNGLVKKKKPKSPRSEQNY